MDKTIRPRAEGRHIDLSWITVDESTTVAANAGNNRLHVARIEILRIIDYNEAIVFRRTPQKIDRVDFDYFSFKKIVQIVAILVGDQPQVVYRGLLPGTQFL